MNSVSVFVRTRRITRTLYLVLQFIQTLGNSDDKGRRESFGFGDRIGPPVVSRPVIQSNFHQTAENRVAVTDGGIEEPLSRSDGVSPDEVTVVETQKHISPPDGGGLGLG